MALEKRKIFKLGTLFCKMREIGAKKEERKAKMPPVVRSISSPFPDSFRRYLGQWPKCLSDLDRFLLSLRLGEYNNPTWSDSPDRPDLFFCSGGGQGGLGDGAADRPDDDEHTVRSLPSKLRTINRSTLAFKALELIR